MLGKLNVCLAKLEWISKAGCTQKSSGRRCCSYLPSVRRSLHVCHSLLWRRMKTFLGLLEEFKICIHVNLPSTLQLTLSTVTNWTIIGCIKGEILNNCGSLFAHMKDLRLRGAWNIELMDVSLNLILPSRDYVACILNWWPVAVISSGLLLITSRTCFLCFTDWLWRCWNGLAQQWIRSLNRKSLKNWKRLIKMGRCLFLVLEVEWLLSVQKQVVANTLVEVRRCGRLQKRTKLASWWIKVRNGIKGALQRLNR